ncbi:DNA polymerase III subunit beta [Nitrosomonas aestuarii]|uniref:DNA polymerase III subunit beta n=1 Tax=Nitrosomonas aestuarii TaxID=52441 RepID=UPI000D2FAC3E|nr:DNA polymerase III subunit beta [Nitrosomonas aestuarii]PTN12914.1 DNA polymerase III beta subunit [Nitrosomonas aestuarii]
MLLIKTKRDSLLKPLQMVTGIVEKRQTSPILSNVLIQKNDEVIYFLTSDMEMQIKAISKLNNNQEQNFSLTVSAKKMQDILRSLDVDAEVSLIRKDEKLQIKSGKSLFNLQILPPEDFPIITTEDNELIAAITLQQNTFKNLLNNVQYAIAEQDIRYFLNGVLLAIENDELKTVGTDTHRLALALTTIQPANMNYEVILPRKTIIELGKLLKDNEEPINIEIFAKRIRFSFSNIVLISRVIDGKYPNYSRAIPDQSDIFFDLDRLTFLHALQRVSILSNPNELLRGVRLIISKEKLGIICKNNEQEEATDEIAIQYDDDTIDFSLNITYLFDFLNNILVDTFRFSLVKASGSVLITIPGKEDFKYVIMPMKI